ncbi:hypothetical protein GGX14DRAFT_329722, partial [Mycena pura]
SELYCDQLLYQNRGFPLYVPEPQRNLPAEYKAKGVTIGDVGRVTPEGAFDFLFNVYCSAHHPINANGVPDDFSPLPSYLESNVFCLDYDPGDFVASSTVEECERESDDTSAVAYVSEFPGTEFRFKSRGPQGAVLALPQGSHLTKLEHLETLRRYAAKHAESWYRHVNAPEGRGRQLVNGFLYLITGCEQAESWGMACYQNVE